jgi:hypothetical protein
MGVLAAAKQASAVSILFVGMDPTPTYAADGAAYAFLRDRFYYAQVDYVQASVATTASANGYDLLVISSTPGSEHIRDKWDTIRTGILNWEQAVTDDDGNEFMMADSLIPVAADPVQIDITNTSHPITAGFAAGTINLTTRNASVYFANTLGAGVVAVGTQTGEPANQAILAADVGDQLRDGSLSPNRRVMFPMDDGTFSALSADGLRLFGQAAQWAGDLEKPVLLRYTFPTTAAAETGPGFGPTTVAPLLDASYEMAVKDTAGNITIEISNPGASYATPVLRVDPNGNSASLVEAVANDKYFEFSLAPLPDAALNLAGLEFDVACGGGGTRGWGLFSSVDGFLNAIATSTIPTLRPNFTHVIADLRTPQFQDLAGPITFRMYVFSGNTGATVEFDNFELVGMAVPEPATVSLALSALLGLAVWRRRRSMAA